MKGVVVDEGRETERGRWREGDGEREMERGRWREGDGERSVGGSRTSTNCIKF